VRSCEEGGRFILAERMFGLVFTQNPELVHSSKTFVTTYIASPNDTVEWLALVYIQEFSGSNLDPETSDPD
jgi:hypothetical protein